MYHSKISSCVHALHSGGVIAYPTEAVWGLGCDPFNAEAVAYILELKQRAWQKGVILVAAEESQFEFILHDLEKEHREKMRASWPGHTTWLVPHQERIPQWVCGEHDTIALRVSAHPIVGALCKAFNGPIVSTSLNPQGFPPALTQYKSRCYFSKRNTQERPLTFAPGHVGAHGVPSQIIDLLSGKIIR